MPIGSPGSPYTAASATGKAIKQALREISTIDRSLRVLQYALMPDHLHLILYVEEKLDEIIGRKLAAFKVSVNCLSGVSQVFERGFNDQILTKSRSLDIIFKYLRANPYRLATRQANPGFFQKRENLLIGDTPCQLYGNIHLLDNPFREQVIVHRADTDETYSSNRDRWLYNAANGGILVSPFISKREKEIRREAEELGGRFILITNEPLEDRQKPMGKDFELCTEGRLLIIAPLAPVDFSRSACLTMNSLAARLADGYQPEWSKR